MGVEFIFSVISTIGSLLSSIQRSGCTSTEGEGDGIERDLNYLERLLKRIQAALHDAGEREIRDEYVKLWLSELKVVAYEAEDILDDWQYELLRRQIEQLGEASESGEASSSSSNSIKRKHLEGFIPDGMAQKIKGVIERFEEISKDKEALSWRDDDGERRGCVSNGLLPTSHMVDESAIFGRDEDKKKILDFVLSDNTINPVSIIAIVGMGGIGKTTLTQLVYNDSLVQTYFDIRAWAYVSPEFDVIKITKQILESIDPQEAYGSFTGLSAAQHALIKTIRKKKILIVLDDVWNESPSKWEQFLEPLRSAELVRIILTTRNKAVAEISRTTGTHDLGRLSEDQSNLLFEHYAFADQFIDETSCLRNIGVQILKKCAGLPLAIKSIGRVLSYGMDEASWRAILDSELWESDGKDEIFPALKVSYNSLPAELKPCFIFCSLFPKGSKLGRDEIIYMWIARSYIRSYGSKSAEDLGNAFIHELYVRSFLTKVHSSEWDAQEYFTMHDLIHDLARSISAGEFCTITQENVGIVSAHQVYHRENFEIIAQSRCRRSLIRKLITNNACRNFVSEIATYISDLVGLRVLKLSFAHAHVLRSVANLKHLRYLELVGLDSKLERLPSSISLLYNLVVLKLVLLQHLIELPFNIEKLLNLRFLSIHFVGIRELPESLGQLCNLQCLSVSSCQNLRKLPTNIGSLTNLKQLYIVCLKIRELPESLCMLQKLQTLSLYGCRGLTQLPNSIGNLTNLRRVICFASCIKTLPKSINCLHNLKIMKFDCSGSPVALVCEFEGLLNKSSLNFSIRSIERGPTHLVNKVSHSKVDIYTYVKYKRLIERLQHLYDCLQYLDCLQPLQPRNDLVKLKLNGYEGIGYASLSLDSYPRIAIAMHCHIKSDNFFTELGELPSLKSLSLVGITSIQKLQFSTPRLSVPRASKVLFPSLKEIEFADMFEWNVLVGGRDGDFPELESLKIENCPKLSEVPNFHNLRELVIIRCSFTKLELDLLGLQLLESLHIEECFQLTSLHGLQSLHSIRTLFVAWCRLLKNFLYPIMPEFPLLIQIVACPSLKDWCQIQQLDYIKDFSCKSLVTAFDFWNVMKKRDQNFSVEDLVIKNSIKQSLKLNGRFLSNLTSLEIRNSWKLETLEGLSLLKLLKRLVLWDCPQLQLKKPGDGSRIYLPPFLQSLAVHGCHSMLSLDLLVHDPSFLTELEVTDCKRLMHINSLHELSQLETLAIIQCPHLLLELLPTVPDCVVISKCPRLKAWCEMHSIEPLDGETE